MDLFIKMMMKSGLEFFFFEIAYFRKTFSDPLTYFIEQDFCPKLQVQ